MSKVDPVAGRFKVRCEKNGDIAEIEEVEKMLSAPMEVKYRRAKDECEEDCAEEREDSKGTASIEICDFMFGLRGVVYAPGDEEPGEDKEQVYSHPSGIADETPEAKSRVCSPVAAGEVIKHYGKSGDSAETTKRSIVPFE